MAELPGAAAPVETSVATTTATQAPASTADQTASTKPEVTEKLLPQSEVDRIVAREKARAARQADRIASERAEALYYKRLHEEGRQTQQQTKGKPLAKDYQDVDEFMDALTDWKLDQRESKSREERETHAPLREAEQRQQQHAEAVKSFVEEAMEKLPDFEELVLSPSQRDFPITDAIIAAAMDVEQKNGAEVLRYLGLNPGEMRRIAKLAPTRQVIEIDKIAAKVASPKSTTTPPPIVPNDSANAGAKKDWSSMSTAEHVEAYRKRKK